MQRAHTTALFVACAFSFASASSEGPPPITRETLIGVWEAAPSWAQRVYRLEIRKSGGSYLAFTFGSEKLVYRLKSSSARDGRLRLHFQCLTDRRRNNWKSRVPAGRELNELWISGKGVADERWGTFEGTLRMKDSRYDEHFTSFSVSFTKPPWTRDLAPLSRESEKLIREVKSRE